MPFFHKNYYDNFGCIDKYTSNSTDAAYLTCPKNQMATLWESNVGIDVDD